jgi:flagellar biosynthesis/type III secretory pathway ATPase
MSEINPIEFGKLINAVETLTRQVAELDTKVESLNAQITGGKGMVMGMLFAAGGVGAGAAKLLEKFSN